MSWLMVALCAVLALSTAAAETVFHDGPGNLFSAELLGAADGVMHAPPAATAAGDHIFTSVALNSNITDKNGTACYRTSTYELDFIATPAGGCNGGSFSPVLDNGQVFQGCYVDPRLPSRGGVFQVLAETGAVGWNWTRPDIADATNISTATQVHAVTADLVIVSAGPYAAPICKGGVTAALNRTTGALVWSIPNPWAIARGLLLGDTLFMPFACGDVVSFDVATGAPHWSRSWTARLPSTIASTAVVVQDELLYIGARGALRVVNSTTGLDVWTYYLPVLTDSITTGPLLVPLPGAQEPLVVFGANGVVRAVQAVTQRTTTAAGGTTATTTALVPVLRWTYEKICDPNAVVANSSVARCLSAPVSFVEGGVALIGTWDGFVVSLDLYSGVATTVGNYGTGDVGDAVNGFYISNDRLSYTFTTGHKVYQNTAPPARAVAAIAEQAPSYEMLVQVDLIGVDKVAAFSPSTDAYLRAMQGALASLSPRDVSVTIQSFAAQVLGSAPVEIGSPPAPFSAVPAASQIRSRRLSQAAPAAAGTNTRVLLKLQLAQAPGRQSLLSIAECNSAAQAFNDGGGAALMEALQQTKGIFEPETLSISAFDPQSPFRPDQAFQAASLSQVDTTSALNSPVHDDDGHSDKFPLWAIILLSCCGVAMAAGCVALAIFKGCRSRRSSSKGSDGTAAKAAAKAADEVEARSTTDAVPMPSPNAVDSLHAAAMLPKERLLPPSHFLGAYETACSSSVDTARVDPVSLLLNTSDSGSHAALRMHSRDETAPVDLLQDVAARARSMPTTVQRNALAVAMVIQRISHILQSKQGVFRTKYLLQHDRHMLGPQGLVQLAEGMVGGHQAIKFFCNRAVYENELRIRHFPAMKGFFVDVLEMGEAAEELPPFRISLKGQPLHSWLLTNACSLLDAMRVLGQVSLRLEMLHAAGFVHRNVKPSNIIWLADNNLWTLTDLGSAFEMGDEVPLELMSIDLRSSPPELVKLAVQGAATYPVSGAMDAWGLGLLCIKIMTGHDAFPTEVYSRSSVLAMLEGRMKLPWENKVAWAEDAEKLGSLRDTVMQLLERDPNSRIRITNVRKIWMGVLKSALGRK